MSDQVSNQSQVPPGPPLPGQAQPISTASPAPPVNTPSPSPSQTDGVYDPVEESTERSYEEARMREDGTEVPNFNPADPDHQEARLEHSNDYKVGDLRELGYEGPVY